MAIGAMSIGGLNGGMTVKEVATSYQIFGNGGQYNEPYTYYYVEDHDGNRILDNTNNVSELVLSVEDATVMNRLLREPINNPSGTARIWEFTAGTYSARPVPPTPTAIPGLLAARSMPWLRSGPVIPTPATCPIQAIRSGCGKPL